MIEIIVCKIFNVSTLCLQKIQRYLNNPNILLIPVCLPEFSVPDRSPEKKGAGATYPGNFIMIWQAILSTGATIC
jgi:hypothetical protein